MAVVVNVCFTQMLTRYVLVWGVGVFEPGVVVLVSVRRQ
jgi:hypothetical protein